MAILKKKYYDLNPILSKGCKYSIIFGERSNGKTYSTLKYGIEQYVKTGEQIGLVRRWRDDFIGKRGEAMFNALVDSGEIARITGGEWTGVFYRSSRWYLCRYDENNERETDETPFCYGFAITSGEHDKSTSYPKITTVIFDEFIARSYIPDEFVLFMNILSTIIRDRENVRVFMLGNTINKYCPYFSEMGLKDIKNMKQGDIAIYHYGDSGLSVAVEYCKPNKKGKESDAYFAFNNPSLQMITNGEWELDIYPHNTEKIRPKDILFTYFIIWNGDILQCEVVERDSKMFTFVHRKTGLIKDEDHDIIFSADYDPRPNWRRKILKPATKLDKKLAYFFQADKVFYQDNEVGDIVRNYLEWCLA